MSLVYINNYKWVKMWCILCENKYLKLEANDNACILSYVW